MDDLNELYQQVILDHSRKPRNFRLLPDANRTAEGYNPLCGDHFTIYLKLEGNVIREISFQGAGCAISKAAASIMTDQLQGKTVAEAKQYFERYQRLVKTGNLDEGTLGKLCAFAGVHNFPTRVKCAVLPWHAMLASLKGAEKQTVSTEPEEKGEPVNTPNHQLKEHVT
jgi:nitrogen fixation NifU-like protein